MEIPATELIEYMVNPETNIVDFDREFLANDDWLQMMQQKYDIDMMLFGEITPLQLVEDNLFAAAQVSEEEAEKKTETETEEDTAKEELIAEQKEETEKESETKVKKEVETEAKKALIAEQKEETEKEEETKGKKRQI